MLQVKNIPFVKQNMKPIITLPPFYCRGSQTHALAMDYCGKEYECEDWVPPMQDLVYGLVITVPLESCKTCPAGERHTLVGRTMNSGVVGRKSQCLQCTQWKLGHSSMWCPCSPQLVQCLAIIRLVGDSLCPIGYLGIVRGEHGVIVSGWGDEE